MASSVIELAQLRALLGNLRSPAVVPLAAGHGTAVVATVHPPVREPLGPPGGIIKRAPIQTVNVIRDGEAQPFLRIDVADVGDKVTTLPAGSVWFRSSLLAAAAPATGYTGLHIAGGSLSVDAAVKLTGTQLVIPSKATLTLALQLDLPPAASGDGPGIDARKMVVATPTKATLRFGPVASSVVDLSNAALDVYGNHVPLFPKGDPPAYDAALAQLAIPYKPDVAQLTADPGSSLFLPAGRAPVNGAAWLLPVTQVADPTTLGAASGAGGLLLRLGAGLSATWTVHDAPCALRDCLLVAEPGTLGILALAARSTGPERRVPLWGDGASRGALGIGVRETHAVRFSSAATGTEVVFWQAPARAQLDRPVTAAGGRVPLVVPAATLAVAQTAAGTALLAEGSADPAATAADRSFVLANAVLRTGPATSWAVFGTLESGAMTTGAAQIELGLSGLVPTLPDPYVTNLDLSPLAQARPGTLGVLRIDVTWKPDSPPTVAFRLPDTADSALRALGVSPNTSPTHLAVNPIGASSLTHLETSKITAPAMHPATSPVAAAAAAHPATSPVAASPPPLVITHLPAPGPVAVPAATGEGDAALLGALGKLFPEGGPAVALVDVSSNASQFGVAWSTGTTGGLTADGLYLTLPGNRLRLVTLPAVQWEPVVTRDGPAFPSPVYFADCGGPTQLATESVALVRAAPRPALDFLVDGYRAATPLPIDVLLTLPFGMMAVANLRGASAGAGPGLDRVSPAFPDSGLTGGDQLSMTAPPATGAVSAGLPGAAIQLHNAIHAGVATGTSVLAPIDATFNANFAPGKPVACVPVERLDLSGYGESLFSDWHNPTDAAAMISKVELDVVNGRTALEVVQAYSVLYPWAQRVVRTITIQRENGATVVRHDSGWQAVGDGVFQYPPPALTTHPGVVRGVRGVVNLRDTGQAFTTSDGATLMAVRFDATVMIDGVVRGGAGGGVPARDQLGFVQLTPSGSVLSPAALAELLAAYPTIGGAVDCVIDVAGSGLAMRVTRVGAGATGTGAATEFAMAAYGSPALPAGGQWSVIRQSTADDSAQPVDPHLGVPLVRRGPAPAGPPASEPYRFADPADLTAAAPSHDYGILHATGSQKLLFPRPVVRAGDHAITSARQILFADPYALATTLGPFPPTAVCVTIPDPGWKLATPAPGQLQLQLAQPSFAIAVERTLIDAAPVQSIVRYHDEHGAPSDVRIAIDSTAAVPWSFEVTRVQVANRSDALGEPLTLVADYRSTAGATPATTFENARMVFGPVLQPIMDALAVLGNVFGNSPPYEVAMTNQAALSAGIKLPFVKLLKEALKHEIPILEDLDLKASIEFWSSEPGSKSTFEVEITLAIPVTGVFVIVVLASMKVEQVAGATPTSFRGTAVIFQIGIGCGLKGKVGPFDVIGYGAVTGIFVAGDVTGIGWSILSKIGIDLEVVDIEVSLEAASVSLTSTCSLPGGPQTTTWSVSTATVAVEISIFWVIDIEFEYESTTHGVTALSNPSLPACDFPDVL